MKTIEITLLPKDFINNDYLDNGRCALAKATTKHFKKKCTCDVSELTVWNGKRAYSGSSNMYNIKNDFGLEDYDYVKSQYNKDPLMKKAYYVVKLKPM